MPEVAEAGLLLERGELHRGLSNGTQTPQRRRVIYEPGTDSAMEPDTLKRLYKTRGS